MAQKHKIQILMKHAAAAITVECDHCAITKDGDDKIIKIDIDNPEPSIMYLDINEIAAVVEVD